MSSDLFTPDRVRTMLAIAAQGSFSKAAVELGVSQPSVSQQVRRIEDELDRRLYDRAGQRLVLTADGEAYLAFARAMQDVGEEARRHFAQPPVAGSIRLGVTDGFARTLLTGVLAIFFEQFPNFELEATCDASHRLVADFEDGRYDIAVFMSGTPRGEVLQPLPLCWIGCDGQVCPVPDPVPLVIHPAPHLARSIALQALQGACRSWRIRLQTPDAAATEAAVRAGIGVSVFGSFLPRSGVVVLDGAARLPALPEQQIVLERRTRTPSDRGIEAICAIIRTTFAQYVSTMGGADPKTRGVTNPTSAG